MTTAEKRWAVIGLLINAMVWGLSWWPLRQLQSAGFHPLWSTLLVFTPALLVSGIWYRKHWRVVLSSPALWALAMAAGATNVGFTWSVTTGDVIRVILLFYTMPAWAVLLAWWLLKEKPTAAAFVRLIIAFVGLWLVLWEPGTGWPMPQDFADVLALMAGFMFALNNVLLRRGHNYPSGSRVLAMFFGGVLLNGIVAAVGFGVGILPSPNPANFQWVPIALGLSMAIIAANVALQFGAARLTSAATSIIMLSEVVFASVSSVVMGAAVFAPHIGFGALCIMAAALMAAVAKPTPSTPHPKPQPSA